MTEIPEDIREKASDVYCDVMKDGYANGQNLLDAIALAILSERQSATAAERERCAKIAENTEDDGWSENFLPSEIAAEQSARIAAAIRGGSHDHYNPA